MQYRKVGPDGVGGDEAADQLADGVATAATAGNPAPATTTRTTIAL
jgi:hypothetical protein